jgi:8-oxo-dGTP diphosphatase
MKLEPRSPTLTIAVAVFQSRGRFLVARREKGAHCGGTWEFPGGKQRRGESVEEALRREVEEETGLEFREAFLLHLEEYSYPDRTVNLHFFLCLEARNEPQEREGHELRWVTLQELEQLEIPAGNRGFLKVLQEQFGDGANGT